MREAFNRGKGSKASTQVFTMAAPVGVVNSPSVSPAYQGMFCKSSAVAGAGTGMLPCAHFTNPMPARRGAQIILLMLKKSSKKAAATISTMACWWSQHSLKDACAHSVLGVRHQCEKHQCRIYWRAYRRAKRPQYLWRQQFLRAGRGLREQAQATPP